MRFLAVLSLIGALLVAGCEAPARNPGATRAPAGFPAEGLDPKTAAAEKRQDVWVVGTGAVEHLTLLFAHNIDVAPRVPCKRGDRKSGGWIAWNGQNFR